MRSRRFRVGHVTRHSYITYSVGAAILNLSLPSQHLFVNFIVIYYFNIVDPSPSTRITKGYSTRIILNTKGYTLQGLCVHTAVCLPFLLDLWCL